MKKIFFTFLAAIFLLNSEANIKTLQNNILSKPLSNKEQVFNNLQIFFKSYDTSVLRRLKRPTSIEKFSSHTADDDIEYMVNKNRQLITILSTINPVVFNTEEMNPNDEVVLWAGIFELYSQFQNQTTTSGQNYKIPWDCIRDVVAGLFDITALIKEYSSLINSGASWGSARTILWKTLKRYGGWAIAAGVLYDITTNFL